MQHIAASLGEGRILISDGAWGTFLMAKGLEQGACPELWNAARRAEVLDVARSYVAAGSDLITTNSFGGTRVRLREYGLDGRTRELNQAAAEISREAAGDSVHVMASIGPTGKLLITEEVSGQELYDAFAEQAQALEAGGADACCVETMSALDEAVLAVRAARENTGLEVLCTFTYERAINGVYHTMMGVTPAEMAQAIVAAGASVIGTNCGYGPADMVAIARQLRAAAPDTPILVQANAGLPERRPDGLHYPESPQTMAEFVPALIAAGANILGGCCGTTPAHIRALRDAAVRAVG